jgi:hypothetical protein
MWAIQRIAVFPAMLFLVACGAAVQCVGFDVVVSRVTGEISLVNPSGGSAAIAGYSINSTSGALLPGNWLSIADNYDANDGGLIDPNNNWTPISSSTHSLAEGEFIGDGGSLDAGQVLSLGLAWDPFRAQDLTVFVVGGDGESMPVIPTYESFAADFDANLRVDRNDLSLWKVCFLGGCGIGDADKNGTVNGRDYMIWLSEAGSVGPIPPPGSIGPSVGVASGAASTAIPEPSTIALLSLAAVALMICRRRST